MTEEQERLSQRGLSFHSRDDDRQITRPPRIISGSESKDQENPEADGEDTDSKNLRLLPKT